jgi:hypothetical protein
MLARSIRTRCAGAAAGLVRDPMTDDDLSLWRVSEFERRRREAGSLGAGAGPTVLPTTLMAELQRADGDATRGGDLLEVLAAVLRQREAALLYLRVGARVWPLTVFAACDLYHSPRPLPTEAAALAELSLLAIDPPGLRPPGHYQSERVGRAECYRPLAPLLWQLALHGPRERPLAGIGGTVAYRALGTGAVAAATAGVGGAIGAALERLRRETAALRDIAGWPGMNPARAARLVNALYLTQALRVLQAHPAARPEPSGGLLGRWRWR